MAFSKFARANIIKPDINLPVWDQVRDGAQALGSAFASRGASQIVLKEYNPTDYMLSHCTIVASVDTENGPNPVGRRLEGGMVVDRKYADYYIKPSTAQWINNNNDAWERKLLLSSFRTFVGGENYLEHIQVPELSKGKIIDAAARDIGDSVYIDILVATHRKFRPLIEEIKSKKLQTLSMGCTVAYTICSKCGNVAEDSPQLCQHIKYSKGNTFRDELGQVRKIAELCGHVNDEPGSVKFIEASWVHQPAFEGAVLRNVLSPEAEAHYASLHKASMTFALSQPPKVADHNLMARAARVQSPRVGFQFGEQTEQFSGAPKKEEAAPPEPKNPLDDAVSDVAQFLRNQAVNKVRKDIEQSKAPYNLDENENNTLIHEASSDPQWRRVASKVQAMVGGDFERSRKILAGLILHKRGGWQAVQATKSFTGREILALSRVLDTMQGVPAIAGENRIYRTVLAVSGTAAYQDESSYLAACRRVLGRQLTASEVNALIVKGKLFDLGC